MSKKPSDIDKAIAVNEQKIRELTVINDALRAVQEAKRKLRKPRPLSVAELKGMS